jgi:hypothetical protein
MYSRLILAAAAGAVVALSSLPSLAIQTVTLPQNSDGTTPYQDPDAQAQSKFSTDQNGNTNMGGLGSFHFSVSGGDGWNSNPGTPGYYYQPGYSSQAGYGNPNTPGSEFYNSGYPFGH